MPSFTAYFAAIIGTTVWLRSSLGHTYLTFTVHGPDHPKHGQPSWRGDSRGASAVVCLTAEQALVVREAVAARRKRLNLPPRPFNSCVGKSAIPPWLFEEIKAAIDIQALMMGKKEA